MAKIDVAEGEKCTITSSDIERIAPVISQQLANINRPVVYIRRAAQLLMRGQELPSDVVLYKAIAFIAEKEGPESTAAKSLTSKVMMSIGKKIHSGT